jgi:hypothetical protein
MWPDFDVSDLTAAVEDFRRRHRRFGGVNPSEGASTAPSETSPRRDSVAPAKPALERRRVLRVT